MSATDAEIMADTPAPQEQEDDPITASYQVFLNPRLPLGRRLLVLQHPNRTDNAPRPPPTELRLKSEAGMVEVDMPLETGAAYDREKGLNWGKTLKQSMTLKNGGSHGLAGGFGAGAVQQRGGATGRGRGAKMDEDDDLDWNEAVRQDKVLRTQTLGGQYPDSKEVQYMVGVFQGKNLHLTPVSSLVHLRTQLHHIDATAHLERQAASKDSAAGGAGGAGGPASNPARAIHMTVKSTTDGNSLTTETMADRLRIVQGEPWRKMRYTDENEEAAWDVYSESMFLRADGAASTGVAGEEAKETRPLEEVVPRFETRWDDKKLLESISGIVKGEPSEEDVKAEEEAQLKALAEAESRKKAAAAAAAARPRGATTGVSRRGGRGGRTAARGAAV